MNKGFTQYSLLGKERSGVVTRELEFDIQMMMEIQRILHINIVKRHDRMASHPEMLKA